MSTVIRSGRFEDKVVVVTGAASGIGQAVAAAFGVERVLAASRRIDVLVNNAGINMAKRIAELSAADWDKVFDTNLKSVYSFCKAVWPGFQALKAGAIVNVSSVMGQVGGIGSPAYCSTKAGIIMLSRCLAKDGEIGRAHV